MRYLKLFVPFIIILGLYALLPRALASLSGMPVAKYNGSLNGANILQMRLKYLSFDIPTNCDIYFVGTSRTMADYDPSIFVEFLEPKLDLQEPLCALNLGNLGNSPRHLLQLMKSNGFRPRILILEFSPQMFYRDLVIEKPTGWFSRYRSWVQLTELKTNGRLKKLLMFDASLSVRPDSIYFLLAQQHSSPIELANLYEYWAYSSFGRGQTYHPDGQVSYRNYLSNPSLLNVFGSSLDTDLDNFIKAYSGQTFNEREWSSFEELLTIIGRSHVVIVRPPVAADTYNFENNTLSEAVARMITLEKRTGVLYVDLNPNDYQSVDHSHIDGLDTDRVTRDLASMLLEWILKSKLINNQ